MRCLLFYFLFSSVLFNAQNQRFFYEYRAIKDSTEKDKVSKEMMLLDITPKGSLYYSYSRFKKDSTDIAIVRKSMQDGVKIGGRFSFSDADNNTKISKTYPEYNIFLHSIVSRQGLKVKDERKMQWKILPEKQKIGEWNAQKATSEFAGRQWVAWYAEDIPLPDGPYKFHGLPGLIVKIEDTKGNHIFELKGISNITDDIATAPEIYRPNEIEIDRKKYRKLFWEDRKDPAKYMKQMILGGANVSFTVNGNVEKDPAKMMKIYEKSAKEKVRRDNNHIEIDMLIK